MINFLYLSADRERERGREKKTNVRRSHIIIYQRTPHECMINHIVDAFYAHAAHGVTNHNAVAWCIIASNAINRAIDRFCVRVRA